MKTLAPLKPVVLIQYEHNRFRDQITGLKLNVDREFLFFRNVLETHFHSPARSYLLINLDGSDASLQEDVLSVFLTLRLINLRLETIYATEGQLSLHYQFSRCGTVGYGALMREINALVSPAKADLLITKSLGLKTELRTDPAKLRISVGSRLPRLNLGHC